MAVPRLPSRPAPPPQLPDDPDPRHRYSSARRAQQCPAPTRPRHAARRRCTSPRLQPPSRRDARPRRRHHNSFEPTKPSSRHTVAVHDEQRLPEGLSTPMIKGELQALLLELRPEKSWPKRTRLQDLCEYALREFPVDSDIPSARRARARERHLLQRATLVAQRLQGAGTLRETPLLAVPELAPLEHARAPLPWSGAGWPVPWAHAAQPSAVPHEPADDGFSELRDVG